MRDVEAAKLGVDALRHPVARQHEHAGIHRNVDVRRVTPPQQRVERERNLDEEKVGRPFPSRHRTERAHRPRSKRLLRVERSHLFDHCAHRQLAGAAPGGRLVTVHEQELIDAVRRGGQEIATEPEQIPVTRIETRNRPAAHGLDFVGDRDARHSRAAEMVVGDEECGRDAAQDADLMADRPQIGPSRRLDLAHELEAHQASSCTRLDTL